MKERVRVVVCDDHAIFREGIKQVLLANGSLEIVAEAATGLDALRLIRQERPRLVIMDISMPEVSGIDVTRQVMQDLPETRVVILSVHSRKMFILEALKAGARGYVLKDSAGEKLLSAVAAVLNGECYLDSPIAQHIVDEFIRLPARDQVAAQEELTDRERQVLLLIVEGCGNKEIAAKLHLSPKTVDNHRSRLMAKLGRHDVVGLVKYAIGRGLVDPDSWGR
ncbi:MAG: response regulator transcription factor [Planctomycetes bacterium]|nr:response regulator transcription factor [Planctomycetota bacterium]